MGEICYYNLLVIAMFILGTGGYPETGLGSGSRSEPGRFPVPRVFFKRPTVPRPCNPFKGHFTANIQLPAYIHHYRCSKQELCFKINIHIYF